MIPNVDDGAPSEDAALAMLEIAVADGIDRIIATPHVPTPDGIRRSPEDLLDRIAALNILSRRAGISVEVLPGSEILLEPNVHQRLVHREVLTVNQTPYALFELPLVGEWPTYYRSAVYELQLSGVQPILAHVERYPSVQRDPDILHEFIATGVLNQANSDSILRHECDRTGRTSARLLRFRMVHIVSSDAHSAGARAPRIRAALDLVAEITDCNYADWIRLVCENVIEGKTVHLPDPVSTGGTRWWSRIWTGSII